MPSNNSKTGIVWLTPAQVAKRFHVSPITVRNWANTGKLEAVTTPGGHRRFNLAAVEDFATLHQSSNHADAGATLSQPETEQDTILVIDNDQSTRDVLAAVLKLQLPQANTLFAQNAFEAGFLAREHQPRLLFLDVAMFGINAEAICRFMRSQESTQTISIIAMCSQATDRQKLRDAGAMSVLRKPFDLSELDSAIKHSLI